MPFEKWSKYLGWSWLFIVCSWLFAAAMLINIDHADGYATVVNSQYFLGISEKYAYQRGPLFALLLVPAEYLSNLFGLDSFDLTIHHLTTALLHSCYLFLIWHWLTQKFGYKASTTLAYILATCSYIFFSYAPYISHDIFPGALFLGMLIYTEKYICTHKVTYLFAVALMGVAAALIKQTFILFWLVILIAVAITSFLAQEPNGKKATAHLLLAAIPSGVLAWICYSLVLPFEEVPFLLRPLEQARVISELYHNPLSEVFPWWIYFRNISAYGLGAMLLIVPSLIVNVKSKDRQQQRIAIAWISAFCFMQLTPFKEVRYLAFLAPLTAFLLAPTISALMHKNCRSAAYILIILAIDCVRIVPEAGLIGQPFYRNTISSFFEPIKFNESPPAILNTFPHFSFISPSKSQLLGDRYHHIHHIGLEHVLSLIGYPLSNSDEPVTSLHYGMLKPGDAFTYANATAVKKQPWHQGRRGLKIEGVQDPKQFFQFTGRAINLSLTKTSSTNYQISNRKKLAYPTLLIRAAKQTAAPVLINQINIPASTIQLLYGAQSQEEKLDVIALEIRSYCNIEACSDGINLTRPY